MKIIKQGTIPKAPPPWWTEIVIVCQTCDTHFQLEESDTPDTGDERAPDCRQWVACPCPVCHKPVSVERMPPLRRFTVSEKS